MTTRSCPYGGVSCDHGRHGTAQAGSPPGGHAGRGAPGKDTGRGTRPAPGWVTDPGTLRRVRDALALLAGGGHAR